MSVRHVESHRREITGTSFVPATMVWAAADAMARPFCFSMVVSGMLISRVKYQVQVFCGKTVPKLK